MHLCVYVLMHIHLYRHCNSSMFHISSVHPLHTVSFTYHYIIYLCVCVHVCTHVFTVQALQEGTLDDYCRLQRSEVRERERACSLEIRIHVRRRVAVRPHVVSPFMAPGFPYAGSRNRVNLIVNCWRLVGIRDFCRQS